MLFLVFFGIVSFSSAEIVCYMESPIEEGIYVGAYGKEENACGEGLMEGNEDWICELIGKDECPEKEGDAETIFCYEQKKMCWSK